MTAENLFVFIMILPGLQFEINAQEIVAKENFRKSNYGYLGTGWGGQKSASDFGFVVQVDDASVVALSIQGTQLTKLTQFRGSPVKQITSAAISLLYGRIIKRNWGHMIFMAGPTIVNATHFENPHPFWGSYFGENEESSIGILLQGTIMPSAKFIGLGANLFVNLNGAYTYSGITFNLAIGNVNYKKKVRLKGENPSN